MPDYRFPPFQVDEFSGGIPTLLGTGVNLAQNLDVSSLVKPHQVPHQVAAHQPQSGSLHPLATFHAEPIAPLRQRDEQALDDIFSHAQVEEIVTDIYIRLHQLCPEPCWDDDPFEFLKGYL